MKNNLDNIFTFMPSNVRSKLSILDVPIQYEHPILEYQHENEHR